MNPPDISPVQRAQALEALVRKHADAADSNRRLSKEVAAAFAENGLYRIGAQGLIQVKSQTQ